MKYRKYCCNIWDASIWRASRQGMEFWFYLSCCSFCSCREPVTINCAVPLWFRRSFTSGVQLPFSYHQFIPRTWEAIPIFFPLSLLVLSCVTFSPLIWSLTSVMHKSLLSQTTDEPCSQQLQKILLAAGAVWCCTPQGKTFVFQNKGKNLAANKSDKILSIILPLTKNKNNLSLAMNDFSRA